MKNLLFIALTMVILAGCAATPVCVCPTSDVIFFVQTPAGRQPIFVQKGFLNDTGKDIDWMTRDEYDRLTNEYMKRQRGF